MFKSVLLIIIVVLIILFFKTSIGISIVNRIKGTADEAINKDAGTIEGATAHYNAAIAIAKDNLDQANKNYSLSLGRLDSLEKELYSLRKQDMQLTLNINNSVDKNDDEAAKMYLEKQQQVKEKIKILEESIPELKNTVNMNKDMVDINEKNVKDLEKEKDVEIFKLKTAHATVESKNTLNGSSNKNTDRMLAKVRSNIKKAQEEAIGTQIAYENSTDTKMRRIEEKQKADDVERQLQELKKQRGKV